MTIKSLLQSEDPLSLEAITFLLTCKDENMLVDYKESFENDEKHWLDLTKDLMAFSNTSGGYIIYGIRDSDFEVVGISHDIVKILRDTNLIMQKANRNVAPPFTQIRSIVKTINENDLVFMHIPRSKGKTHIVIKEGFFIQLSGQKKNLLYPGMIYIRRSSTNAILTSEDFEQLINTRLDEYKNILFDRISKVVDAPPEHDILVFDPTTLSDEGKKFVISDAPDASPVKGMSFTVSPTTDLEEISGWIALRGKDPKFNPGDNRLWEMYSKRQSLTLNKKQKIEMIRFNLLQQVPVFYWMKNLLADDIKDVIEIALKDCDDIQYKSNIIKVSRFLGNSFTKRLLSLMGKGSERIPKNTKDLTIKDPHLFFTPEIIENQKIEFKKTQKLISTIG